MNRRFASRVRPACLVLALGLAASAAQALVNPPIRMASQGIEYMCGGLGHEEEAFMQTVAPRWAASFQFGMLRADGSSPVAGVRVVVRSSFDGQPVMQVTADAPHMLARLEPGSYRVEATLDGLTLIQPIQVVRGVGVQARFMWPSNLAQPVQAQAALQATP